MQASKKSKVKVVSSKLRKLPPFHPDVTNWKEPPVISSDIEGDITDNEILIPPQVEE